MEITNFLSISIVGVIVSFLIQYVNEVTKSHANTAKGVTLFLSVLFASLYVWIYNTPFYGTFVSILGVASTIYGFFLKKA